MTEAHLAGHPGVLTGPFVTVTDDDGLTLLATHGDLDLLTAGYLIQAIDDAVDFGTRQIVIDLTLTGFLSSAGVEALMYGRNRIDQVSGQFSVVASGRSTARVIAVFDRDNSLNLHCCIGDALADLN